MEQTKAIILHWPKTATVPGSSVIATVHMLLASCLHCFTVAFLPVWKNSRQLVLWETQATLSFFFTPHTHTHSQRERLIGNLKQQISQKIKPFSPPISFGKPVRSKWFPKPQVIRLCLSPWLHLQDSEIKRPCSSSEMSSNRLNSSAVIKYSSMDVSAPVPAENGPALKFCSL